MSTDTLPATHEPDDELRETASRRVILTGVSWDTYQRLAAEVGESRGVRLDYSQGELEIRSPDPGHEIPVDVLEDVVKTAADTMDLDWLNIKASQLEHPALKSGGQPDACFYFREASRLSASDERIDAIAHPPELVVEVDRTHSSRGKEPLYERLGVQEFWRMQAGTVSIFHLEDRGYIEHTHSLRFPWLTAGDVNRVVAAARTVGTNPGRARRAFADWARERHATWVRDRDDDRDERDGASGVHP